MLGIAFAVSLNHSHFQSMIHGLTAFGWAMLAALGGTLVYTVLHWSTLVNALLPERKIWKKSLIAGSLLALALWLLGASVHSPKWTPAAILPLALIPWAVKLWRVLARADVFDNGKQRLTSLFLLISSVLLVLPDFSVFPSPLSFAFETTNPATSYDTITSSNPRVLALLSALCIAAASSLSTAQERKFSSFIYWSIPCAIAAVILSLFGWISVQTMGSKNLVTAFVDPALPVRVSHAAPALIFGIALLTIRPKVQIHNTLKLGRGQSLWWQHLGLFTGFSVCLILSQQMRLEDYDFLAAMLLFAGLATESKVRPKSLENYATLTIVEQKEQGNVASCI